MPSPEGSPEPRPPRAFFFREEDLPPRCEATVWPRSGAFPTERREEEERERPVREDRPEREHDRERERPEGLPWAEEEDKGTLCSAGECASPCSVHNGARLLLCPPSFSSAPRERPLSDTSVAVGQRVHSPEATDEGGPEALAT